MIEEVTMEIHHPLKKDFMGKFDRYEPVILDHTAMITAKNCLRKYFYQIVLGRVPNEKFIVFTWGNSYHKFRETLERAYGFGDNKPKEWDGEKAMNAMLAATNVGLNFWKQHGKDQGPEDKFSWMTGARLMQSFKAAFKHWEIEKKRNAIEVIAIEQPFNVQLSDESHRSGRADQIVRWAGKLWGRDFKTTSKDSAFYQRQLDPNEQFTGYTFAESLLSGEPVSGQIIELLFNAKPTKTKENGPEIISLVANRTKYQLEMWEKDHIFWNSVISKAREEDHYPMSEVACSFCPYHQVCKQGNEQSQMYQLESNYTIRPWDNTKVGDE